MDQLRGCFSRTTATSFKWQVEHPYACSGTMWEKDLDPNQDELLKYVLDKSRPSEELIIKQGQICLTREDFWSLGLSQCMESNIGNACLKIVEEAARRHGKNVHIVDLYAVPTWKDKNVDPVHCLPVSATAHHCERPSYSLVLGTKSQRLILWRGDGACFSADEQ
uniref:Uncharacterized protein n=1 Tax=Cyprinus carpio TaxID=7962 RepID=A0A8C1RMP9_CYPCA